MANANLYRKLFSVVSLSFLKGCFLKNKFDEFDVIKKFSVHLLSKVKTNTYSNKVMYRQIIDFIMLIQVLTFFNELCIFFCAMGLL